ncbi:MAG: tRNA (N6-isopentenyl adenosine(37)-C2)-methylthiotransferase MiaB [Deltaproteobacteria bacterium]
MFDDNRLNNKDIDETRQGEVFYDPQKMNGHKKIYIESYGCQMNFSDSEIVASIMKNEGYGTTRNIEEADLVFINTCSIRDKAEQTVLKRLTEFKKLKKENKDLKIGVLGCMAERLKEEFLQNKIVDIVVGPDAYRSLPELVEWSKHGNKGINVLLSKEETYDDIQPVRLDENGVSAFITITRGCNNMCSFCVVPYTRGRERSRNAFSIVAEADDLFSKGYREVTLLGQNVDSYNWKNPETGEFISFARLLELVAGVNQLLRVRFATSHPKDMTDEVLLMMAKYHNICKYIHLPVQSGNSRILELMNRTYTREWYKERIDKIYQIVPDVAISSDIIAGFCTETEEEHMETLSIMKYANYSMSYMFYYSERPRTIAERKLVDDIPMEIKKKRLNEIIKLQNSISLAHNKKDIGKNFEILIEGKSKKSQSEMKGRNTQNKVVVFPGRENLKPGDYVIVKITEATSATLKGLITEN